MGRIVVLISTTPDGFAEPQNVIIDPEFFEFTHSLMATSDTVIFGRKTFEQFQDRWVERLADGTAPWMKKMAEALYHIKKIVISSSLKTVLWNNTEIIETLDVDFLKSFKENGKGDLLTFGSISLVETLTEMKLVDDYYFNIQPVIAGKGTARFFTKINLEAAHPLKYAGFKQMASGAHVLHYRSI